MQHKFISAVDGGAHKLILFFNGWAMTPVTVEHLSIPKGYDVLIFWDYRDDEAVELDFMAYEEVRVVAWSMGVWAADRYLQSHPDLRTKVYSATALAGTGYPVDDSVGIPREHCLNTLSELTEENRPRFNRRTCGGKSLRHIFDALAARSTEEIRNEMLRAYESSLHEAHPLPKLEALGLWTRSYIGLRDRVLPPSNQETYWRGQGLAPILLPEGEHYLLRHFVAWSDLWH